MKLANVRALANGLSTDHPIPDLPFVDDSHIPVDDGEAIAAVSRNVGPDMWAREDPCPMGGGWQAFTTDPLRHDLAWFVRWHPEHGRSVIVYQDADIGSVHSAHSYGTALLFRSGNYWWDGVGWHRPSIVFDPARRQYVDRIVPAAETVTAGSLLQTGGDASGGGHLKIIEVRAGSASWGRWLDHLAWWAEHRRGTRPLDKCVVRVDAPELGEDELVGVPEMAVIAGLSPSTLRAYRVRGQTHLVSGPNRVPLHQATINGRPMWSRPVANDWAEQRKASANGLGHLLTAASDESAPGIVDSWDRYAKMFIARLWNRTPAWKRWVLRGRSEQAVREMARDLGWYAAADITNVVPMPALGITLASAIEGEFARGLRGTARTPDEHPCFRIPPEVVQILDWLIRFDSGSAELVIATAARGIEREFGLPRKVIRTVFLTAMNLDGELESDLRHELVDRVLPPV
jgi:hypothetical protein